MKTTTLNKIKNFNPCQRSWKKLLKSLNKTRADDEELSFSHIYETLGTFDTIWCLRTLDDLKYCVRIATYAAAAAAAADAAADAAAYAAARAARAAAADAAAAYAATRAAARAAAYAAARAAARAAATRAAAYAAADAAAADAALNKAAVTMGDHLMLILEDEK